jgi:hypothetical protein
MSVKDMLLIVILLLLTKQEDRFWTAVGLYVVLSVNATLGFVLFGVVIAVSLIRAYLKDKKTLAANLKAKETL